LTSNDDKPLILCEWVVHIDFNQKSFLSSSCVKSEDFGQAGFAIDGNDCREKDGSADGEDVSEDCIDREDCIEVLAIRGIDYACASTTYVFL